LVQNPGENDLKTFFNENSGPNGGANATTAEEHTVYYFEMNPDITKLPDGMDKYVNVLTLTISQLHVPL
jgi:secreted Zn-dependent insulinase-like peptidase